jgi:hypothetical protein
MPRVSQHFKLGRTQATLDFVDVDVIGDTRLFVDPRAIERLQTDWGQWCLDLVRDFFERVLAAVRDGRQKDGLRLLYGLGEPNQTHLGMSRGAAKGSGVGKTLASELWEALSKSQARRSGLLEHLEDTALLVEGISLDRVSDITTNIIREPLIEYTKEQCVLYGIPTEQVGGGATWDYQTGAWEPEQYEMLPTSPGGALLLVPKIVVRRKLDFDPGEYYNKYILKYLEDLEYESPTSALVRTLKSGRKRVYRKDVRQKASEEYGPQKRTIIDVTVANPVLLSNYRKDKDRDAFKRPPVPLDDLPGGPPNWNQLLTAVTELAPGAATATHYHRAIEALVTALFYPGLINPRIEHEIDQGRKRVDLRYTITGIGGFFRWVQDNYPPQPHLYVECKNYSDDLGNEELDQLTGRFSPSRGGSVGLLVNRAFSDKDRFIQRCRDAALKNRGYVVPLDDEDLTRITNARRGEEDGVIFRILTDRFAQLIE